MQPDVPVINKLGVCMHAGLHALLQSRMLWVHLVLKP